MVLVLILASLLAGMGLGALAFAQGGVALVFVGLLLMTTMVVSGVSIASRAA